MSKGIYSIKDEKAGSWFPPFQASNAIDASRQFAVALKTSHIQMSFFKEEFSLYMIGFYTEHTEDDENPISLCEKPKFIVGGEDAFKRVDETNITKIKE